MRNLSAMFVVVFVVLCCASSLFAQDKAAQIAALEAQCADLQKQIDEKSAVLAPKLEKLQQEFKKIEPFLKEMQDSKDRLSKAAKEGGEALLRSTQACKAMLDNPSEENQKALEEASAIFEEKSEAMQKVNEELKALNKKVGPMVDALLPLQKVVEVKSAAIDSLKVSLAKKRAELEALKSGK